MEISTLLASCALEKMNASMEHTIIQFLCLARTVKGVLVFLHHTRVFAVAPGY